MATNLARATTPSGHLPSALGEKRLTSFVKTYDPPYTDSKKVYAYINENLAAWIEDAISIRENFSC